MSLVVFGLWHRKEYVMTPTKKQWIFAKVISSKLNIPMPMEYTRKAYFKYIQENKNRFYSVTPYNPHNRLR